MLPGESLNKHLNRIIPALINALGGSHPDFESAKSVILSVQKEPGPAFLIEELVKCCRDARPDVRATSMRLLHVLTSQSSADLTEHVPQLMIFTTESLNDPSDEVCEAAWLALEAIVKVRLFAPWGCGLWIVALLPSACTACEFERASALYWISP